MNSSSTLIDYLHQPIQATNLIECPEEELLDKEMIKMQQLKEAMDLHSASACGIAWVMMAFSVFGILSNAVSLRIFTHESMRCACNVLLAGLSCIDLVLSIFVLPVFVLPALNLYYKWKPIDRALPYVTFVLYPLTLMTQTASVWVFVIITCERWAAVCRPLQARRYSSCSNAKRAFTAVCLTAILYNLVRFGEFRLVTFNDKIDHTPRLTPECAAKFVFSSNFLPSTNQPVLNKYYDSSDTGSGFGSREEIEISKQFKFRQNFESASRETSMEESLDLQNFDFSFSPRTRAPFLGDQGQGTSVTTQNSLDTNFANEPELQARLRDDKTYMFIYYFGLYLLTHFAVPFSILLIVNIHVVWTILRTRAQRRRLTTHERREHRIALMMGVVVLTFLLCNTIPFAMNLLEAYDRNYFRHVDTLYISHLVNDIGNLLVVVNSSTTSFIYYAFSQRYRRRCASNYFFILCSTDSKKAGNLNLIGRNLSFKDSYHAETCFDPANDYCPSTNLNKTPHTSRHASPRRLVFNDSLDI